MNEYVNLVDMASDYVIKNASNPDITSRERLLVHCKAGIGRTGTTIALVNALITIKAQRAVGITDPDLSMFSIVRRLRE